MDLNFSLKLIEILIALAIILQSIEVCQIRSTLSDFGVWRWSDLRQEFKIFPTPFQKFLEIIFRYPNIIGLQYLRIILAILLVIIPHPLVSLLLLLSTILTSMRWRGTLYGGSDYMTIIILTCIFIAHLFSASPLIVFASISYIAIQACLSYFIGGYVKILNAKWRSGEALSSFLHLSNYICPEPIKQFSSNKPLMLSLSWLIIIFELTVPLALLSPTLCLIILSIGFTFHLLNIYTFGLNHFLYTWTATYPAIYALSFYVVP